MANINIDALDTAGLFEGSVWINGEEHEIAHVHREAGTCYIHLDDPIELSDGDGTPLVELHVIDLSIR